MKIDKKVIKPCEHCDNPLLFELSNGKAHYAVSIEAILACLKIAEQKGAVPEIDAEWWLKIQRVYEELRGFHGCI
ncbi:hypothetical protein [Cysteiniphilum litorale]|uniref:hypothetical protein n=1 Tax=Cysteiniphilum litorale TaxID=2056700 RepID=UPI003F884800